MDKNLERDFEEFKQALANVETAYGELVDYVEIVGGVCKSAFIFTIWRTPSRVMVILK